MSQLYDIDDLVRLMSQLRDPETGCPWDIQQTFASIIPHTLEEAYELADAIERGTVHEVKEELGDLLFQVIFLAQIGSEEKAFTLADVIDGLVRKLIRRHPHVFAQGDEGENYSSTVTREEQKIIEIKQNWEAIKQKERAAKQQVSVLDDVPLALPALTRAAKLQKRAANVGFDWQNIEDIFLKLDEEVQELRDELPEGRRERIEAELGDLLFCCVNLARRLDVNPEAALRGASHRFESRFRFIETSLQQQGATLQESALDTMEALWNQAKQQGL